MIIGQRLRLPVDPASYPEPIKMGLCDCRVAGTRSPVAGEWFLSGPIPTAYRAQTDLDTEQVIVEII